jgi:hypothetical protein
MEFTLCSNDLLITDPYHEMGSGRCLISHVKQGIWYVDLNGDILLHTDYGEDDLIWQYSDYSCDISQELIMFSDFDTYCKVLNREDLSRWGVILTCDQELIES